MRGVDRWGRNGGDVQLRSVDLHRRPCFSMQVCQQAGSWSNNVLAVAEDNRTSVDIVIVRSRVRIVRTAAEAFRAAGAFAASRGILVSSAYVFFCRWNRSD